MDGGAWPFLVGGVICLVNSDNERDSGLLNKAAGPQPHPALRLGLRLLAFVSEGAARNEVIFLEGQGSFKLREMGQ